MKIVIAPDSFKGSLTAQQAAEAIRRGVLRAQPGAECVMVPMADGGEGTVRSLVDATGGRIVTARVTGPLGGGVEASYGLLGDGRTGVIEMAAASGIRFVDAHTGNPLITTTYGTGELMLDALDQGVDSLIIGMGGSATNDGGAGMAQALGARLLDKEGNPLPFGGAALADLATVDCSQLDPRLGAVIIKLASDVTNPLTGEHGASHVFGLQKGATPEMIERLDACLAHYAHTILEQTGRDVAQVPGAGAAGGLGAGFLAFTNATMRSGVDLVVDATGLKAKAAGAQYCITGEGGIDLQTRYGKTPVGVAQAVKEAVPDCTVIALAGNVGGGIEQLYDAGIDAIFGILPGACTLEEAVALEQAQANLARTAENVARLFE
ncbi:glycerate kinase [Bifidobacterium sp.]|uniref:glycerate kinase n=1 Tax=Bifidobacterium sp. TaxID=41200 RepID=UPI0025BAA863|nr:glycerate kinase [Bifidobacterium sp.]MCH4208757.1 glycerate kinase [Bifidobacterium sp.]MCI1224017.1 glycerate kinase [Bifidobacterium sp.]